MWNAIQEKSEMLSRLGDFWYKVLSEKEVPLVHKLCHLPLQSRIRQQLSMIEDAVLAGGYYEDNFIVLRFKDEDVIWNGQKRALQVQHGVGELASGETTNSRSLELTLPDYIFLRQESSDGNIGVAYKPVAIADNGDDNTIEISQQQIPDFDLVVDPNIKVTSIQLKNGRILYEHIDFASQFGKLSFNINPINLFPEMKVFVKSAIRRYRNLYCFPLGVDVYGPVDYILRYERSSQSLKMLYLASAQAAGLPVIRKTCKVLSVSPMLEGVIYSTTDGFYAAPFPHTHVPINTYLEEGTIIGSDELYQLILPSTPLPVNLEGISLDYALPVQGLTAPNSTIQIMDGDKFRPAFTGDSDKLEQYHNWLKQYDGKYDYAGAMPAAMNGIAFVREILCKNRCVIARINGHQMPSDMYLRLIAFLRRELPLGSVLTTAPLRVTISEKDPVHV